MKSIWCIETKDGYMKIKVSVGEIVDKYTILEIKLKNAKDSQQKKNIKKEYEYLERKVKKLKVHFSLIYSLKAINSEIWDIEDEVRRHEAVQDFSIRFVELARSVYTKNDERAAMKKKINLLYDSDFVEEKILPKYEGEIKK